MEAKKKLLIGLGIGAGLLIVYGPGLVRWAELKGRQAQIRQEIRQLAQDNQRLIQETKRLREDPSYAEAVARRQLGLVRPGETKVRFRRAQESLER